MKKLLSSMFAVLFLTGVSFAQPPEPPQPGADGEACPPPQVSKQMQQKMEKNFEEIAKEINLTDEQKQQIETMAKADKDKKKEIRKQMKEKFKAIDAELLKENYDINVINNLTAEIQSLQGEMAKMNIDGKIQMRNILTYDQFKQIEQMRQDKKNKFANKAKEIKEEGIKISSGTVKSAKAKAEKINKSVKASTDTVKKAAIDTEKIVKAEIEKPAKPAKKDKKSKKDKSSKNKKK